MGMYLFSECTTQVTFFFFKAIPLYLKILNCFEFW